MRIAVITLVTLLLFSCKKEHSFQKIPVHPTIIDSLTDLHQVREFVKTVDASMKDFLCIAPHDFNEELYATYEIKQQLNAMIPKVSYIKDDFDDNGYTDLIVTGELYRNNFEVIAIMNFGTKPYTIQSLSLGRTEDFPTYPKHVYIDTIPAIELYAHGAFLENMVDGISKKALTYALGTFVEYNATSANYKITKIDFSRSGCHGSCPVFDLTIHKDSMSTFKAIGYNFSRKQESYINGEGSYETMIDKNDFEEIVSIMNYINIKGLSESYLRPRMHQETATLTVNFADGSSKTIRDTGLVGTNGLNLLYKKLSELRFNQDWRRIP